MRTLFAVGLVALAMSLSGFASAATLGEPTRNSNVEWVALSQPVPPQISGRDASYIHESAMTARQRDRSEMSIVETIGTIIAVAGAGLVLTMTAVGLRHVWTQDPIRDPLGDGPGFL